MANWGIFSTSHYAGVDQGVDFSGSGQIPALDSAVVTDVGHAHIVEGGTYPYVVYRLTAGPYKGSYVYTAENFTPGVHVGQQLRQGQSIGHAVGKYPYIEIGFNKTPKGWNAVAPLGGPTAAGAAMKSYIYGLIGSAPPVTTPVGGGGGGALSGVPVVGGVVSGAEGTVHFLGEITSAAFWLRALEVLGGGLLMIMGLYLLARQVGLAQPQLPPGVSEEALDSFKEAPGIDSYQPAYKRVTKGVRRDKVSHDVTEAGERRKRQRELSRKAQPDAGDVPF